MLPATRSASASSMGPAVLRRSARGEGDHCASWLASLRARRRWRAETSIAVARIWMERQRSSGRRYGARMDDYKIGAEKATLVTNRPAIEGSPFQSADDTWLQPDPDYPAHALDPETKKPLCPHSDPITVLPSATWPPPGIRKCPRCVEEVAKRQEPEPEEQAGEDEAEQTAD